MAQRRSRRLTLERSVEEAMRRRLAPVPEHGDPAPAVQDMFPGELDEAIDRALLVLQRPGRAPGTA